MLGHERDRQAHRGELCSLYRRLHVDEFRHILTTCVDDTFGLAVATTRRRLPGISYSSELYLKSVFRLGPRAHPTDIWQMYGSAAEPAGIRLGCLGQSSTMVDLEEQRVLLMNAWRTPSRDVLTPAEFTFEHGPRVFNWFKQFTVSPLVFVGTSLDLSDWSMWWLLHQRARAQSAIPPKHRSPTLVLTSAEQPIRT